MSPLVSPLLGASVPALCALALVFTKRVRPLHRPWIATFFLAAFMALLARLIESKAASWTGLDVQTSVAGDAGALAFLFALVAPLKEAFTVAASWRAFRSKAVRSSYDGVLFATAAALGFAACDQAWALATHPFAPVWIVRAFLAVPGAVFFAGLWGYALGHSVYPRRPGRRFSAAWMFATFSHALYTHLVYARGEGAILAVVPMLLVMVPFAVLALRQAATPSARPSLIPLSSSRDVSVPPSMLPSSGRADLATVRAFLRHGANPIRVGWVGIGVLVCLGGLISGVAITAAIARVMNLDFSIVDERHIATMAPLVILAVGAIASFSVAGFVVARASGVRTVFEPAVASAIALFVVVAAFSAISASAAVFVLASTPIAWAFGCAGAWVGLSRN